MADPKAINELPLTAAQIKSDADYVAASKAVEDFVRKHQHYFECRGRDDPNTGKPYVERNRALDDERRRLHQVCVALNVEGHKIDAEAKLAAAGKQGTAPVAAGARRKPSR